MELTCSIIHNYFRLIITVPELYWLHIQLFQRTVLAGGYRVEICPQPVRYQLFIAPIIIIISINRTDDYIGEL